jgi:hypothetical protein
MPLPRFTLTEGQARLLAELMFAPIPVEQGDDTTDMHMPEVAARGLDHDLALADLPRLVSLGLAVQVGDSVRITDLGAAIHFEAQQDAAFTRLGDVVRFADALERTHSRLAVTLRMLAQGDITLRAAIADAATEERSD